MINSKENFPCVPSHDFCVKDFWTSYVKAPTSAESLSMPRLLKEENI